MKIPLLEQEEPKINLQLQKHNLAFHLKSKKKVSCNSSSLVKNKKKSKREIDHSFPVSMCKPKVDIPTPKPEEPRIDIPTLEVQLGISIEEDKKGSCNSSSSK
jgi:hypothetical protein